MAQPIHGGTSGPVVENALQVDRAQEWKWQSKREPVWQPKRGPVETGVTEGDREVLVGSFATYQNDLGGNPGAQNGRFRTHS
jgi:hypothetical protein